MTTPPTPAGWYPDPDGSGGQRYWDGNEWTEHQSPAAEAPAGPAGGSHRRPDADEQPEPDLPSFEPSPPPPSFETPSFESLSAPSFEPSSPPSFEPSSPPPDLPPAPFYDAASTPPARDDGRKKALTLYAGLVGALLLILIAAVVYGVFFNKADNVGVNASGNGSSSESATTTTTTSESTETSDSPSFPPAAGDAVDGPLSFEVHGVEVGSTVVMADSPLQKDATGEYNVVHMTVTNNGTDPAAFVAAFQKLNAAGTVYNVDDQATAYLEGTFADLEPGASADVSIAFDVPPGTTAESVELHADPTTPGVVVPFS